MESVSKVIKNLMINEPFYGLFACSLNKEWNSLISTAGVCKDGINFKLTINKDFWDSLSPDIRYGVIKHELLHLTFFHVVNLDKYTIFCNNNMQICNVAMDLEVQSYIDEKYWFNDAVACKIFHETPTLQKKKGTKYYIEFLQKIENTPDNQPCSLPDSQDFKGNESTIPADQVKKIKELMGQGSMDDHSSFSGENDKYNSLCKKQIEWQMKGTAEQVKRSKGEIPGELTAIIEGLFKIKPPVFNWRSYFRKMLGFAYDILYKKTRRKESNRFTEAFGLKHNKKHSILVAIDTSGSVSKSEFQDFFSEIKHIWKAGADIDIIECDTKMTKPYKYKGKTITKIHGGGGTSFKPAIEYYNNNRNKYNVMVYFTDGYGDQDKCKPFGKVLWIITSDGYQEGIYPGYKICIPKTTQK